MRDAWKYSGVLAGIFIGIPVLVGGMSLEGRVNPYEAGFEKNPANIFRSFEDVKSTEAPDASTIVTTRDGQNHTKDVLVSTKTKDGNPWNNTDTSS